MAEPLPNPSNSSELMLEALRLMELALQNLDDANASGDIGAHLDHAIQRLKAVVNSEQA